MRLRLDLELNLNILNNYSKQLKMAVILTAVFNFAFIEVKY